MENVMPAGLFAADESPVGRTCAAGVQRVAVRRRVSVHCCSVVLTKSISQDRWMSTDEPATPAVDISAEAYQDEPFQPDGNDFGAIDGFFRDDLQDEEPGFDLPRDISL
jgi:hypothetical protein